MSKKQNIIKTSKHLCQKHLSKHNSYHPLVKRSNLFVYFCLSLCTKTQSCLLLWISLCVYKQEALSVNYGFKLGVLFIIIIINIIPGEWRALSLRVEWWNSGPASLSVAWLGRKGSTVIKDYGSSTLSTDATEHGEWEKIGKWPVSTVPTQTITFIIKQGRWIRIRTLGPKINTKLFFYENKNYHLFHI